MNKLIKAFKKLRNRFPSPLPIGMTAFETWASDIIKTYDFPDNDSTRFALATQIMHVEQTGANKPKHFFSLVTHKGAANQIAHAQMYAIKDRQAAKAAAEEAKNKSAEAPALSIVASSEPKQ